jgi:hypothetical protein|tara:strand:+ start:105 stop:272 length:168 start_codon:yes stop_codon:yes gene_type:complete
VIIKNLQNEMNGFKKSLFGLKGTNGMVVDVASIKRSLVIIEAGATIIFPLSSIFG